MININDRFGSLVVAGFCKRKNKKDNHLLYVCRCDCGKEIIVRGSCLRSGQKSCGCINKLNFVKRNTKHKMFGSRIYCIWNGILSRTKYKSLKDKKNYWGRGISVCKEWEDFSRFYEWSLKNGYSDNLTIDRIDVNGDYCPENCRWATRKEQSNNTTKNVRICFFGKEKTISEWSDYLNISYNTLWKRIKKCNSKKDLSIPVKKKFIIEYLGERFNLKEICIKFNKNYKIIHRSYKRGKKLQDLISKDIKILQEP